MATDCAMGLPTCVSGADTTAGNYKRSTTQRSSITDENVVAVTRTATHGRVVQGHHAAVDRLPFRSRWRNRDPLGIARWGGIRAASVPSPITIAACEFDRASRGRKAVEFFLDDPEAADRVLISVRRIRPSDSNERRTGRCVHHQARQDGTGDWVIDGKAGNDLQKIIPCLDKVLNQPNEADRTILIPLYNDADCGGRCQGNAGYPIKGYAWSCSRLLIKGQARFPAARLRPRAPTGARRTWTTRSPGRRRTIASR